MSATECLSARTQVPHPYPRGRIGNVGCELGGRARVAWCGACGRRSLGPHPNEPTGGGSPHGVRPSKELHFTAQPFRTGWSCTCPVQVRDPLRLPPLYPAGVGQSGRYHIGA